MKGWKLTNEGIENFKALTISVPKYNINIRKSEVQRIRENSDGYDGPVFSEKETKKRKGFKKEHSVLHKQVAFARRGKSQRKVARTYLHSSNQEC